VLVAFVIVDGLMAIARLMMELLDCLLARLIEVLILGFWIGI